MEAWLQGGRSGHCGVTEERSGDCAADDQGSTPLTAEAASSLRTAALECGGYCLACERCRFITVSPDARDCSWYRACDRLEGSSEHHTLLVDNASAHLRERMRPSPLRLPLPGVPVLPRAQRSTSRGAKHPCATTVVSLVVYESSRWVDALLTNLFAHAEECTCAVLHLNSGSSYGTDVMAEWRSRRRVAVNRHRVPVMRGHGGILYAHVLNAIEAAALWPATSHLVLQASNMMWVRPGMEVRVRLLQHSVGHVACTHWAVRTHRLVTHPLYLELTERGRCALHYHEGAFYPLRTVLEFARRWQDFLYRAVARGECRRLMFGRWVYAPCAGDYGRASDSSNSTLGPSPQLDEVLLIPEGPEEALLPAFAVNEGGLTPQPRAAQLCWRDCVGQRLSHTVSPAMVAAIRTQSLALVPSPDRDWLDPANATRPTEAYFAVKRVTKAVDAAVAGGFVAAARAG